MNNNLSHPKISRAMDFYRVCKYCHQTFDGRSNQKYCSTRCKSAVNNQRMAMRNAPQKYIEQAIKANRRIVKTLETIYGDMELPKESILRSGINQDFNTGIDNELSTIEFYEYTLQRLTNGNYKIFYNTDN